MRNLIIATVAISLLIISTQAHATIVDVTVAIDKTTYSLGEEVKISVTAYNPNPQPVTFTVGAYPTSYIMDGTYDWAKDRAGPLLVDFITINPYDSFKFSGLTHGYYEMLEYPLTVGTHTIVGEVLSPQIPDGKSDSIQFEVVPEPATLLLLGLGAMGIRLNHHKQQFANSRHK